VTGAEAAPDLKESLAAIVGPEHVDPGVERYLTDITENPPGKADWVVRPGSADEVAALVAMAHARGIPLTPVVAGYNVAGLAIPRQGGVVVDLTRMDRILELDRDAMYVLVEPGVTFGSSSPSSTPRPPSSSTRTRSPRPSPR